MSLAVSRRRARSAWRCGLAWQGSLEGGEMRRATRPSVAAHRAHERARWPEAPLGASRARPQPPRRRYPRCGVVLAVFLLAGCSVLSLDLRPRIRPLEEHTVAGQGTAKLLLLDLSGVLADDPPGLSLTPQPPRVPLLPPVR